MSRIWEAFTNQKQWESYLKNLIKTNDKALYKSIILIYEMQTDEERYIGESKEENNVGFSKVDAYEMGVIAKKIKQGNELTSGEIAKSRNKMQKYWKQLMIISKRQMKEAEDAKLNEEFDKLNEELAIAQEEQNEKLESFREHNEILRKCSEEGISCSYGICDECPLTTGFQMRLKL